MNREEELRTNYREELEDWNWDRLLQQAKDNAEYDRDADGYIGRAWLGTVFGLTPSGKVYTPWAYSNLTPCEHCDGGGQVRNPKANAEEYERLHKLQQELRMSMLDIWGPYHLGKWPEADDARLDDLVRQRDEFKQDLECDHCGGLGYPEAFEDEIFREELEAAAARHGGFIDYSDENIYFAIAVDDPEDVDGEGSEQD